MTSRIVMIFAVCAVALVTAAAATAGNGGRPLSATLTGANEVPGPGDSDASGRAVLRLNQAPGDSDASGRAVLRLNQGQERICFKVSWADVDGTVVVGHIHPGATGEVNPPLVDLFSGSFAGTDSASGCSQDPDIDRGLIKAIRKHPAAYYVNVHSTEFPAGAARGQLSK